MMALPLMSIAQEKRGKNGNGYGNGYGNYDGRGHSGQRSSTVQPVGQVGSALSVSSDNGERFFLILNGIKQNVYPQSRVRVEDLPMVQNDVQIIFDDNRTPAIMRTITFMDPVDGNAVNLSLKLTRDRNGYARLVFNRMSNIERDYRGEQGEYIMHYGRDNAPTQVVVTTPPVQVTPAPPPPPPAPMPMNSVAFSDAVKAIKSSSFDDTRLSTAKTIANNNYFTVDQVITICKCFSFSDTKLDFAKYAFRRTVDNNSYYRVNSVFSFDSEKTALNDFVNANR